MRWRRTKTIVATIEPAAPALLDSRARAEAEGGGKSEAEAALRHAQDECRAQPRPISTTQRASSRKAHQPAGGARHDPAAHA